MCVFRVSCSLVTRASKLLEWAPLVASAQRPPWDDEEGSAQRRGVIELGGLLMILANSMINLVMTPISVLHNFLSMVPFLTFLTIL